MKNKHLRGIFTFLTIIIFSEINAQEASINMQAPDSLMTNFMEKKLEFNQSNSMAYCIQLYSGKESVAKAIVDIYKKYYPDQTVSLRYDRPWWKPQTGVFLTKREADIALKNLNKEHRNDFKDALVVPYECKD